MIIVQLLSANLYSSDNSTVSSTIVSQYFDILDVHGFFVIFDHDFFTISLPPVTTRARLKAIEDEKRRKEEEEQQKFDALPDWKKNIILKKRQGSKT